MVFNYKFWKFFPRPALLGRQMKQAEPRRMTLQMTGLFLFAIALFVFRDVWGIGTESFTTLIVTEGIATFSLARLLHLIGVTLGALLYVWFFVYGMAFLLSAFTNISYRAWKPVQLGVTALFLFALLIDTAFQVFTGTSTVASVFSFGPLAWTYLENEFVILLLNQISIPLIVAIFMQYQFARHYEEEDQTRTLFVIMTVYLFLILIVAAFGMIPFDKLATFVLGGGAS